MLGWREGGYKNPHNTSKTTCSNLAWREETTGEGSCWLTVTGKSSYLNQVSKEKKGNEPEKQGKARGKVRDSIFHVKKPHKCVEGYKRMKPNSFRESLYGEEVGEDKKE